MIEDGWLADELSVLRPVSALHGGLARPSLRCRVELFATAAS